MVAKLSAVPLFLFLVSCKPKSPSGELEKGKGIEDALALSETIQAARTGSKPTPLFHWTRDIWYGEENGKSIAIKVKDDPVGYLTRKLAQSSKSNKSRAPSSSAEMGGGIYFSEDPASFAGYGDVLLIISARSNQELVDYSPKQFDFNDAILKKLVQTEVAAIRYPFSGWNCGKNVVVRDARFLDLTRQNIQIIDTNKSTLRPWKSFTHVSSLKGKGIADFVVGIGDRLSFVSSLVNSLQQKSQGSVPLIEQPSGKLTETGSLHTLWAELNQPPEDFLTSVRSKSSSAKCRASPNSCLVAIAKALGDPNAFGFDETLTTTDLMDAARTIGLAQATETATTEQELKLIVLANWKKTAEPLLNQISQITLQHRDKLGAEGLCSWK
jgi:hypothetical protein